MGGAVSQNSSAIQNIETISGQYLDMKTCQQLCGENFDESIDHISHSILAMHQSLTPSLLSISHW
jgi:hypothetical protein